MTIPLTLSGCRVESLIHDGPDRLIVQACGLGHTVCCPACGRPSRAVHSRYHRRPADLPSFASTAALSLEVRRFYCRNRSCSRRTFAEQWPDLVASHARRTSRLAIAQSRVGVACGGETGARLLAHLHMPASAATVLRLIRRAPLPGADPPRHVGVDDWALRKGCRYGTIVVDLDQHRVVDLLPDRTATTLADWLKAKPGIAVVARDRSSEYARGTSLGAPQALQVADRWHLLANMRQVVERFLHGAQARLHRLPAPALPASAPVLTPREHAFTRSASEWEAGAQSRARWQAVYDEVRRRHGAGEPLQGIARDMTLSRATVRKFANADSFPARRLYGPGPSLLDPHLAYLVRRMGEGCENAMALWREVCARGYAGTSRQVHRFVAQHRTTPARAGRRPRHRIAAAPTPGPQPSVPRLPTTRQLAWLLVQPASALDDTATAAVARVEQDEATKAIATLARRFTALVRASGAGRDPAAARDPTADLDDWIANAKACSASAIATFAAGLEADGAAVRAALTEPWSSGQAEGQVNRLKLIKRQSYGRASLDLLRRRIMLAA